MFERISGLVIPITTPLLPSEKLDVQSVRHLVRSCIDSGMDCLFPAGSNGEASSLGTSLKLKLCETVLEESNGRIPVVCGALESGTERTLDILRSLEAIGAKYAVVTTTYYIRHSCDEETVNHFRRILDQTNLNILLYNIPVFTHVNMPYSVVHEFAKYPNFAGIKDSSTDFTMFQKFLALRELYDFSILQGETAHAGLSMLIGADGCVPALAPLFPEIFCAMRDAAMGKDLHKTLLLQQWVNRCGALLGYGRNRVSMLKYLMSIGGFGTELATYPCLPLKTDEKETVKPLYEKLRADWEREKQQFI